MKELFLLKVTYIDKCIKQIYANINFGINAHAHADGFTCQEQLFGKCVTITP